MASWRFVKLIKAIIKEIGQDDLSGGAAELTYKLFLALFPFLIFLAALGGFIAKALGIDNPTEELIDELGDSVPSDVSSILRKQMEQVVEERNPALLSFGIVGAIWASASGIGTVMKVMNRIYDAAEHRGMLQRYITSVLLTLTAGVFILGSVVVLVVGQAYGLEIAAELGFKGTAADLVTLARVPVVLLLLLLAVAFLYWATPNVSLPFRWISPGAVVFVALWLPFTFFFGLYVANFGSYNATYGTLGGVVVLLIWLYMSSFILLLGGEINSVVARQAREEGGGRIKLKLPLPRLRRKAPEAEEPRGFKQKALRAVPSVALGAGLVGMTLWRAISHRDGSDAA